MDLGAYVKIYDLSQVMKDNGISVPRLRGLRLMNDEEAMSKEEINEESDYMAFHECERLIYSEFRLHSNWHRFTKRTEKICHYYLIYDKNGIAKGVRWHVLHGKKRKLFKRCIKEARKRVTKVYNTFNKYAGREDVLYIHARIGGLNWGYFDGPELAKKPWFIEKVDDAFDCTYCDIYARIGGTNAA